MRPTIIIVCLATLLGTLLGSIMAAQVRTQAGGVAAEPPPASTKIGLVEIGVLFKDYERSKALKAELDADCKPFFDEMDKIGKIVTGWALVLNNPANDLSDADRKKGKEIIKEGRRQLAELDEKYKSKVGLRLYTEMLNLQYEIEDRVREYARAHGYHLVLAYGEPDPNDKALTPLVKMRREMTAIDNGGVRALHVAGTNITAGVLDFLNTTYRIAHPK